MFPYPGPFHNGYIGSDPSPFSDFHVVVDGGKRIHMNVLTKLCAGMN